MYLLNVHRLEDQLIRIVNYTLFTCNYNKNTHTESTCHYYYDFFKKRHHSATMLIIL